MIQSFKSKETEALARDGDCRKFHAFARVALRKLDMLHAAVRVETLRIPPGNRLEPFHGDREGSWSIRINDRWRICFRWEADGAHDVEIVDYH